jgi:two-component system cell cycle response regulator
VKSSGTILIVDDDALGRETLEALLLSEGHNLAFAGNGFDALDMAAQLIPDLVLLDVMMPDMDGFEVCRRLRKDPALAEMPVVLVTALDDRDSRIRGLEAGADDFVSKPVDGAELRARTRTIMQLNRYRRLLTQRTRFEWVVERTTDGYVMIDARDEILYANSQARLYLGLPPSEATRRIAGQPPQGRERGLGFLNVAERQYHCEPREAWSHWPQRTTDPALQPRYLVRPESPTARAFWLQVDILESSPDPEGHYFVHLRDVTAEIAQQREVRSFHDVIAHKLRTPLAGIVVGLDLLARRKDQLQSKSLTEILMTAVDSAHRLHGTIEGILDYLNASGLAALGDRFVLSQLAPRVAEISSSLGIRVPMISCPENLCDERLSLSQRAVELILWEVLENAKKFHPSQQPTIEIEVSQSCEGVSIQISDDGTTISPEHLGRIWMPYYQGEKYFTGEAQGVGLGLATVSMLMWEVGGTCRAHNRDTGPGVTIELVVPLADDSGGCVSDWGLFTACAPAGRS